MDEGADAACADRNQTVDQPFDLAPKFANVSIDPGEPGIDPLAEVIGPGVTCDVHRRNQRRELPGMRSDLGGDDGACAGQ